MAARRLFAVLLIVPLLASGACREGRAAEAGGGEEPVVQLPNKGDTFKFAVLGDFGTGDRTQFELGQQMALLHDKFKYTHVFLTGDNLYGSERPQDFARKFEQPYKAILDRGVKFYASLGNHDAREQRFYKLFNMDGKFYYTINPKPEIRFFALETSYPTPEQFKWLEDELKGSSSNWKIAYFHHPLYSSGERHGSDIRLRESLEPMFQKHNVSVVFQGHDHFYERTKPQKDITYFVIGSGGKLRGGNIDTGSGITAKGFDRDLAFFAAEIDGDQMHFNVVSRAGQTIDSGTITRRIAPK